MTSIQHKIGRRFPLLNALPAEDVNAWLKAAQDASAAAGETLFREGSVGGWAYVLRTGRIRVMRKGSGGSDVTVGFLGPGDLFGEYALVSPHRSTATCRAAEASTFARLPLAPLKAMLARIASVPPTIKRWLRLHALASYLRDRSFLGFMSAETALEFLPDLKACSFAPGQTIQAELLGADRWHFVESGEVLLHSELGSQRIGPGECFGEESLACLPIARHAEAVGDVRTQSLEAHRFLPKELGLSASQQTMAGTLAKGPNWVGQVSPSDCGFAALAMICAAFGRPAPRESLRSEISVRGLSMNLMRDALVGMGFGVRGVRIDAAQLRFAIPPLILLMREEHYVVLFDTNPEGVTIGDPATAMVRWNWPTLESQFSGFALLPQPLGSITSEHANHVRHAPA